MSYAASNIETRWSSKPTLVTMTDEMERITVWPLTESGDFATKAPIQGRVLKSFEPVLMWVAKPPKIAKTWLYHCITSDGFKYGFDTYTHPLVLGVDYEVTNYISTTITS